MTSKRNQNAPRSLHIDQRAHAINGMNGDVGLTPREYELLACLADHAGAPVSRTELLHDAWSWDNAGDLKTKTVDMHIRRLRMKFERAGLDPQLIATVRGRGYALIA